MNILVLLKHVPDTETRIRIGAGGAAIDESGVTFVISPYDEFAVEEAIKLKEARGGSVTAMTAGPERAAGGLRTALAMGADAAVHIRDERLDGADALTVARVLAAAAKGGGWDLILAGKQGVGADNGAVGAMLAELLDLPQVTAVSRLEIGEGRLTAHREIEGAVEVVEAPLPAVVTCDKGLNEPRYPSLKGIMAAKKKPLETKDLAAVGVAWPEGAAAPARWSALALPPPRKEGRIFTSDPAGSGREVVRLLREEAKVI